MATQKKVCGLYYLDSGSSLITYLFMANTTSSSLSVTGKFYKNDGSCLTDGWTINGKNTIIYDVLTVSGIGDPEYGHIEVEYDGDPDALIVFADTMKTGQAPRDMVIPSESI